jgi:hypothetical protein
MQTLPLLLGMLLAQVPEGPEVIPRAPRPADRVVPQTPAPPDYTPPQPRPSQPFPVWLFAWIGMLPAIYAAQRQQKQRREEEESKTPYAEEDLMNDWEFKILRDPLGRFSRENFRTRILQEEAAGGWQLVEVFDGARLRLKRPPTARDAPASLPPGYDPYRLALRMPPGYVLSLVLGIVLAAAAGVLTIFAIVNSVMHDSPPGLAPLLAIGAVLAAAVATFFFVRTRQASRA